MSTYVGDTYETTVTIKVTSTEQSAQAAAINALAFVEAKGKARIEEVRVTRV